MISGSVFVFGSVAPSVSLFHMIIGNVSVLFFVLECLSGVVVINTLVVFVSVCVRLDAYLFSCVSF